MASKLSILVVPSDDVEVLFQHEVVRLPGHLTAARLAAVSHLDARAIAFSKVKKGAGKKLVADLRLLAHYIEAKVG